MVDDACKDTPAIKKLESIIFDESDSDETLWTDDHREYIRILESYFLALLALRQMEIEEESRRSVDHIITLAGESI